jgi:hypothetical protein
MVLEPKSGIGLSNSLQTSKPNDSVASNACLTLKTTGWRRLLEIDRNKSSREKSMRRSEVGGNVS